MNIDIDIAVDVIVDVHNDIAINVTIDRLTLISMMMMMLALK